MYDLQSVHSRSPCSRWSPPSFTDRKGDFLSCFIDSNVVCQRLARGNQTHRPRDSWSAFSAVESLFSLIDQVLGLQRLGQYSIVSFVNHNQLRPTSFMVMFFTLSLSSAISPTNQLNRRIGDYHTWATFHASVNMVNCLITNSVTTFTNTDNQTRTSSVTSRRILRRISSSLLEQTTEQHARQVFTFLLSVDVRLLESRITLSWRTSDICTLHTVNARSARSACVHTAIVNISAALVIGALALDRHCSATMFGVFLHCLLCCLILMGHPRPSR